MKKILIPLEFIADKINWTVEESWYFYGLLVGNYWTRFGKWNLRDIVMSPFYLLLFLVYVMLGNK